MAEQATRQTSERSTEHATFTIEREYDATPTRVFAAFADPAAKARWFGPSGEVERALDFTVGGREHFAVGGPGGPTYTYDARYEEIVPDARIVYAYTLDRDATRMSVSVATVEFEAAGGGTRLILTEQGVYLDGADTPAEREHGTREMLEKLVAALRTEEA